ncbi:MAG: ATP-dependent DNA ligase [Methylobacteriaceae bacterium]|nr:ATP-dependent DNA ligase [Methylobacteriaceae bacterium]
MRKQGAATLSVPLDLKPMEARLTDTLPSGSGWQFEPKWDGFRCLAFCTGVEVELRGRSGKSLGRYFPDMVASLQVLGANHAVLDGELVIPVGERLSFEALQMRLHPAASRVHKLAGETPARLILFDCLATARDGSLIEAPLASRRAALETWFGTLGSRARRNLRLTPFARDCAEALSWLDRTGDALDGVVAKRLDDKYQPGERAMLKVKRLRTADCVVGGFRYGQGTREVASLLLGLYDDAGRLDHVGFTSAIPQADRGSLTTRLEALRGPPGFTGNAPGGPSRWSTERSGEWEPLKPQLVVEVRYDQVTGGRFRHGTAFLRWRPDKAPLQCTFDQLREEARPGRLMADLLGSAG